MSPLDTWGKVPGENDDDTSSRAASSVAGNSSLGDLSSLLGGGGETNNGDGRSLDSSERAIRRGSRRGSQEANERDEQDAVVMDGLTPLLVVVKDVLVALRPGTAL